MRWCRIRLVLLGLLLCVVHVFSGSCGQRFTDPASSTVLADVVIEGKVRKTSEPDPSGAYNISVAVRKNIFKGGHLINKGRPVKTVTLDKFKNGANDKKNCVAGIQKGRTYLFFLRNSADPKGLYFEIMAMPVKKSKKVMTVIKKVSCDKCAKAPLISDLSGVNTMATEKNVTFTCLGDGNPSPEFFWYKDGQLVNMHQTRYRVSSRKRESTLQISESRVKDSGVYECAAVNVLGEVRRNISLDVINAKHVEKCEIQTLCLNGGTCMHTNEMPVIFCACSREFQGLRCEEPTGYLPSTGQATLMLERTLIIVGIVIAVLVFVVICIASYILAKQGRKRFRQRCNCAAKSPKVNTAGSKETDDNRADSKTGDDNRTGYKTGDDNRADPRTADHTTADNHTADCNRTSYNRSDNSRSDYTTPDYSQPAVRVGRNHVPQGTAHETDPEMINEIIPLNQAKKLPQTILLQDLSSPPVNKSPPGRLKDFSLQLHHSVAKIIPSEQRPEPRGRLAASSVINMELPSFTATGDGRRSTTSSTSPVSENIEMRALPETTKDDANKRGKKRFNSERLSNGSRPTVFVERHLTSPQQSPGQSSSLSLSPQTNLSGTSPLLLGSSTPPSQTLPPSLNSPSQDQPQLSHDSSFLLDENDTSVQPLLQCHKNGSHKHKHVPSHRLFESSSDKDIARYLPLSNNMQGIHNASGYKNDIQDNQLLLRKLSKLSHSNTFPNSKENGLQSDAFSESDEEVASEVPYEKQLDLFISEEDLGLSNENLVSSSFSSVNTPSRQSSQEDRGFRRVSNSGVSRPGIRKHQSEEGSVYKLINKSHAYLQDNTRSRSLDNPQVRMDAPPQSQRLNSTVAGSPDVETYDNMNQQPLRLHNHVYSYDPNDESSPWEGEMNRTGNHSSTTVDDRDRLNRLKDVVPDQQAIPI